MSYSTQTYDIIQMNRQTNYKFTFTSTRGGNLMQSSLIVGLVDGNGNLISSQP